MKCVTQKLTDMMNRLVIGYEIFFIFFNTREMKLYGESETERNVYYYLFINELLCVFFVWLNRFESAAKIGQWLCGRIDIDILNTNKIMQTMERNKPSLTASNETLVHSPKQSSSIYSKTSLRLKWFDLNHFWKRQKNTHKTKRTVLKSLCRNRASLGKRSMLNMMLGSVKEHFKEMCDWANSAHHHQQRRRRRQRQRQ